MTSTRRKSTAVLCAVLIPLFTLGPVNPAVAQTCVLPAEGLVSWWPADGNADDAVDPVNGNHATLQNGAMFGPGHVGQAFSVDGLDDFVQVADAPNLDLTNGITIGAWVNPTVIPPFGNFAGIVTKFGFNSGYGMFVNGVGAVDGFIGNGFGFPFARSLHSIPVNQFSHVAMTYDGSAITVYINGVPDGTRLTSGIIGANTVELAIGARVAGIPVQFFSGLIDEVRIYNRALAGWEIEALAAPCEPPVSQAAIDHFECYGVDIAEGEPKFERQQVVWNNYFGEGEEVSTLKKPKELCVGVDENGQAITDDGSHLTCYDVKKVNRHKKESKFERVDVMVGDEYGERTLTVKKSARYCVPSEPPVSQVAIDHLECYGVKIAEGEPKFERQQVVWNNYFGEGEEDATLKEPKELCVGVDEGGQAVTDEGSYLTCYKLKGASEFEPVDVMVGDEYGERMLTVMKSARYCEWSSVLGEAIVVDDDDGDDDDGDHDHRD